MLVFALHCALLRFIVTELLIFALWACTISPSICDSSSEMCNSLNEKPPELQDLMAALISRKSVFGLKSRLLKGVRAELQSGQG